MQKPKRLFVTCFTNFDDRILEVGAQIKNFNAQAQIAQPKFLIQN